MSISSHSGIVLLVIVGTLTIIGVAVMAAVEARRMEKDKPSILEKKNNRADKEP